MNHGAVIAFVGIPALRRSCPTLLVLPSPDKAERIHLRSVQVLGAVLLTQRPGDGQMPRNPKSAPHYEIVHCIYQESLKKNHRALSRRTVQRSPEHHYLQ